MKNKNKNKNSQLAERYAQRHSYVINYVTYTTKEYIDFLNEQLNVDWIECTWYKPLLECNIKTQNDALLHMKHEHKAVRGICGMIIQGYATWKSDPNKTMYYITINDDDYGLY